MFETLKCRGLRAHREPHTAILHSTPLTGTCAVDALATSQLGPGFAVI
jgi:hypothetical protein